MKFERSNSAPTEVREDVEGDQSNSGVQNEAASKDKQEKISSGRKRQTTASTLHTSTTTVFESEQSSAEFDSIHRPSSGNGWGKGIVADAKQTILTHWKEEMTNLNLKTVAVSIFLFFACIAPAITFGAVYAKATENWIGAVEMILATAWCGIVYSLVGGQPMMINGGTGPVLAFTEILFKMSVSMDVPFLTFNAWIGIWVAIYMCIAAIVDMNRLIVYATRFTDEIFSFLISTIFIINALGNPFAPIGVFYYFKPDHKSHAHHEDDEDYSYLASALLSLILCFGTVQISFLLRRFKFSPFFPSQTFRNLITDFAVVTSILLMSIIANVSSSSIPTETLNVPDHFAPTYACCTSTCETNWPEDCYDQAHPYGYRPWLVNLGNLNGKSWVPFMAAGPGLLAFILVFLDDGITWHLINHPAHKLKHGDAYNYDTLIIGIMVAINSLLGLPWLVAATVRSLNHIHAMAEKDEHSKILSIQETRLTNLGIHLLCLAAIFALDVLKLIPVPVLYGVFLFMGLVSLGTNQFWGRILMFFMQPSKFPLEPYTKFTKPRRMHLYTLIQLFLFVVLYVVKSIKVIAIAFPIIIAACIPIRLYILPRIFTQEELVMLDSDDDTIKAFLMWQKEKDTTEPVKDISIEQGFEAESQLKSSTTDKQEEKDVEMQKQVEAQEARRRRHLRRKKAVSCPPHILFADVAPPAISSYHPRLPRLEICAITEHSSSEDEHEGESGVVGAFVSDPEAGEERDVLTPLPNISGGGAGAGGGEGADARRPRRRRKRSVSCPTPHMLFAEAERQISSQYFFG